jgi:hypothetical protein
MEEQGFKDLCEHSGDRVYCHCVYEWKDDLKALGFLWDPLYKLWYIQKSTFTDAIYRKTKTPRYVGKTKNYFYVHYYGKEMLEERKTQVNKDL